MRLIHAAQMSALVVVAALFSTGCESTHRQARLESKARWDRARAQVKLRLAADQLAAGNVADADSELAAAQRLDPGNEELGVMQARILLAKGDLASAERVLRTAPEDDNTRGDVAYLLGVINEQRLRPREALECYARAADAEPAQAAYVVAIVQLMLQQGRAAEALDLLESYEAQFGWKSAYHAAEAECREMLSDWRGAAFAWRKVADGSDDADIRERLALALFRAGRRSEALGYIERLISEESGRPLTTLRLTAAQCLLDQGASFEALAHIEAVLRSDPRNVEGLRLAACAYARQSQFLRAAQYSERALRLTPNDVETMEIAATMAYRAGRLDRAIELARRVHVLSRGAESPVATQLLAALGA